MSRLLQDIDDALSQSNDIETRGELHTRKAIYLARTGRFPLAKQIVRQLRSDFPLVSYPRVAILVILAEGVIDLYENFGSFGFDRILRANILAIATDDPELVATTSSWRAHVEFERSDFREMALAIERVRGAGPKDENDAPARVARILSDCCALLGDRDNSKHWFQIAHAHAIRLGDQAMLDTLIYNSVAFVASRQRTEAFLGAGSRDGLNLLKTALASSRAYQALIDNKAYSHFVDVCEARLLMLQGDFSGCLKSLTALVGAGPMAQNNFSDDLINTEIAYCHLKLGQIDMALEVASAVKNRGYPGIDADDKLALAWMWREMAKVDDRFGVLDEASERLNVAQTEYQDFLAELVAAISGIPK